MTQVVEAVAEEEVEEEGVAEADMGAALVEVKEEAMAEVMEVAPAVPMGAAMAEAPAEVMEAATGATETEITIQAAVTEEDAEEVVDGVEAVDEVVVVVVEEAGVAAFATNFNGKVHVRLGINVDFPTAKINPLHLHTNHPIHQKTNHFSYFTLFSRLVTSLPSNLTSLEERKHFDSIESYNESPFTFGKSFLQESTRFFTLTNPFRRCYGVSSLTSFFIIDSSFHFLVILVASIWLQKQ